MTTEDRLRHALRARAASVEPRDDGWARIEPRLSPRRSNLKRYVAIALAAAAIPGALAVNAAIQDDDATPLVVKPGPSTTSTPSTTGPAPTTTIPSTEPRFIFPWDSESFQTPASLAGSFARDFLGMPNPTIGAYRAGDALLGRNRRAVTSEWRADHGAGSQ